MYIYIYLYIYIYNIGNETPKMRSKNNYSFVN